MFIICKQIFPSFTLLTLFIFHLLAFGFDSFSRNQYYHTAYITIYSPFHKRKIFGWYLCNGRKIKAVRDGVLYHNSPWTINLKSMSLGRCSLRASKLWHESNWFEPNRLFMILLACGAVNFFKTIRHRIVGCCCHLLSNLASFDESRIIWNQLSTGDVYNSSSKELKKHLEAFAFVLSDDKLYNIFAEYSRQYDRHRICQIVNDVELFIDFCLWSQCKLRKSLIWKLFKCM